MARVYRIHKRQSRGLSIYSLPHFCLGYFDLYANYCSFDFFVLIFVFKYSLTLYPRMFWDTHYITHGGLKLTVTRLLQSPQC